MRNLIFLFTTILLISKIYEIESATAASIPQMIQYAMASGLYQDPSQTVQVPSATAAPAQAQITPASPANNATNNNGTTPGSAGAIPPPVFGMPIPSPFMWAFPFPGQGLALSYLPLFPSTNAVFVRRNDIGRPYFPLPALPTPSLFPPVSPILPQLPPVIPSQAAITGGVMSPVQTAFPTFIS